MSSIDDPTMRLYLSSSISSINQNKIRGMMAEIDLRNTLINMGFGGQVSQGGWIARNEGAGVFAHHTAVFFPETIIPAVQYAAGRQFAPPPNGLHTICATMHQIGVQSFYCVPSIGVQNDSSTVTWDIQQLGVPNPQPFASLLNIQNFRARPRPYNFLRYNTDARGIPNTSLAEEFTKEHLRVSFQTQFMCEMSDIDGVIWGQQYTYPIEIKEKTVAVDPRVGDYFGIDVGPFVKLAFYAAKRGNLKSLFFVREINNPEDRALVSWWFITFDTMAQYASWIPIAGGAGMGGGASSVVKIPKAVFLPLTVANLKQL